MFYFHPRREESAGPVLPYASQIELAQLYVQFPTEISWVLSP